MIGTYDVRIWAIRVRKGRPKPHQVCWKAGTAVFVRSFGTRGLADSSRSGLIQATRRGEAFDTGRSMTSTRADANLASVTAVLFRNIPDHGSVQCFSAATTSVDIQTGSGAVSASLPPSRVACSGAHRDPRR
jgi:hypothetical protein